jgi:hypothetical protein
VAARGRDRHACRSALSASYAAERKFWPC